ncbi:hypothetical protein [Rubellicoccus peritrichatus]|uniref:Uncharacterized protein n=1 Tax=Rubellicoccus peritrichatus TaxID=3080537 RepID=A0AAQ3L5S5_9BACT|nr:hypothetical protein [Puniceicoccus sp. CR14]WOO39740.1 hypothetical protein RZN69_14040 [Puniceicoccus sp. CR14]
MKVIRLLTFLLICKLGLSFANVSHGIGTDASQGNIDLYQVGDFFVVFFYGNFVTDEMKASGKKDRSSDAYYYTDSLGNFDLFLNDGSTQKCKKYRSDESYYYELSTESDATVTFETVYYSYPDTQYISLQFPHKSSDHAYLNLDKGYDTGADLAFVGIASGVDLDDLGLDTDSDGSYTYKEWEVCIRPTDSAEGGDTIKFHFSANEISSCAEICDLVSDLQLYFDPDTSDDTDFTSNDWDNLSALFYLMYNEYYNTSCNDDDCSD